MLCLSALLTLFLSLSLQYCDIGYHRRLEAPFWYEELAFEHKGTSRFLVQA